MTAKVGVLLVHGIGVQSEGSLIRTWGANIKAEVRTILATEGLDVDADNEVHIMEYVWDPQVRAFSSFVVSMWTLVNLPRISAIHTALSYEANERSRPTQSFRQQVKLFQSGNKRSVLVHDLRIAGGRIRHALWRGWAVPALACPLICFIWLVNPFVVVITGFMGLLWPPSWKIRRTKKAGRRYIMPWRPFRMAEMIMTRVVGDAYIWLASPLGRVLSKGSRKSLIGGFHESLKTLRAECSKVIVVAHSQGAAIAVAALTRDLHAPLLVSTATALEGNWAITPPNHLVTVGGGHRLLQGIYESTFTRSRLTLPTVALFFCQGVILYFGAYFMWPYIGFLLLWFVLFPLYVLSKALNALTGNKIDETSLDVGFSNITIRFFLEMTYSLFPLLVAVFLGCAISVALATFRVGRPAIPRTPALTCSWTEIFSRFDPVCIGPAVASGRVKAYETRGWRPQRQRRHEALETWILRGRIPLLEHTAYFAQSTASLRAVAIVVVSQIKSSAVKLSLPTASARVLKAGNFWIMFARFAIILTIVFGSAYTILFSPVFRILISGLTAAR